MKKLREALSGITTIDIEVIIIKCLREHLTKVNRLLEWVNKEIDNDPLEALIKTKETLQVMMTVHGPEERRKQWFIDKVDAMNRKRSALEHKNSKFNICDALDVKNIIKNYRNSIESELRMLEFKRKTLQKKEDCKKTLKIMEVINGIKYEKDS